MLLNDAWHRTLGWTTEELLGQPYIEFVHPHDRTATVAEAAKLEAGFPTIDFRNRYRCKDGTYRWLAWTATAAMSGGIIYASARDVTVKVTADSTEGELRSDRVARIRCAIEQCALSIVWQPIVQLPSHAVMGFEALSRFPGVPRRPPNEWFAEAATVGLGIELELCAIRKALAALHLLPGRPHVAINASPETLMSEEFGAMVGGAGADRIVVEVTEHAAVANYGALSAAVSALRAMGVRIAIDDAGAGFSSFSHIVRLVPEFIKIDCFLIQNLDLDRTKRALTAALVRFAKEIGADLIAEGVETASQLRVVEDLGVDYAQGFLLGRPQPLAHYTART